jgi:hypothetical protein
MAPMGSRLPHPHKVASQGRWHRLHGRLAVAERYEQALVAVGRCKHCGRALRDPLSVARGIGPECIRKVENL